MTDSTKPTEYLQWKLSHLYACHWKADGDKVVILSAVFKHPDGRLAAKRMTKAFYSRGVESTYSWAEVTVSTCSAEIFIEALASAGIVWDEFRHWVAFVYFDGTKSTPDIAPVNVSDDQKVFWGRWHNDMKGHLTGDQVVYALNVQDAALLFWQSNRRNHKLPQLVDIIDAKETYQATIRLEQAITTTLFRASSLEAL